MPALVLSMLAAALVHPAGEAARAQETDDAALIAAVQDVLARRCVPCHGPGSQEEDALEVWACADDLARTVAIEYMVVAGDPEASDLFLLVDEGDMPPPDWEEGGPCEPAELAALRAWIAAGAPLPPAAPVVAREVAAAPDPWWRWLGRLHPATVHFPIALLLAALLADGLGRVQVARFALGLGALGAVAAATLGWVFAWTSTIVASKADLLGLHRWTGVGVAVLASVTWLLYRRGERPGRARWLLLLVALGVTFAGYLGGELTWGRGYLRPPFLAD